VIPVTERLLHLEQRGRGRPGQGVRQSRALAAFDASPAHAPAAKAAALKEAVGAVKSGPLGANSVPDPPNPLKHVAFDALGHANAIGYVVCGVAGVVAALLVVLVLGGGARQPMTAERPPSD
jgi:hypothetical protein